MPRASPDDIPDQFGRVPSPLAPKDTVALQWSKDGSHRTVRAKVANVLRRAAWLDLSPTDTAPGRLNHGEKVELCLPYFDDRYCEADVRFIERARDRPPRIAVQRPELVQLVQRRAFFRMKVSAQVVMSRLIEAAPPETDVAEAGPDATAASHGTAGDHAGDERIPEHIDLETTTQDLSGGGLKLLTRLDFRLHDRVAFRLQCPSGNWMPIEAEVIRVEPPPEPALVVVASATARRKAPHGVAFAFTRIKIGDQDRIVSYLYERQRRARQRE